MKKKKGSSSSGKKKSSKNKSKKSKISSNSTTLSSWIDKIKWIPCTNTTSISDAQNSVDMENNTVVLNDKSTFINNNISVISWNMLAESYLNMRSHNNLPKIYNDVVFNRKKRRNLLLKTLKMLVSTDTDTTDNESNDDDEDNDNDDNDNEDDDDNNSNNKNKDDEILSTKQQTIEKESSSSSTVNKRKTIDILCLQEVDLISLVHEYLVDKLGYESVSTIQQQKCDNENENQIQNQQKPKKIINNTRGNKRVDACIIYYKKDKWELIDSKIIQLNDLATHGFFDKNHHTSNNNNNAKTSSSRNNNNNNNNNNYPLYGLRQSFLRHNTSIIIKLRHRKTNNEICVANCHLYWHPGYEYVKLCQIHYVMKQLYDFSSSSSFKNNDNINSSSSNNSQGDNKVTLLPTILCGDLNSQPNSVVHTYLTKGIVNAKHVAPWIYRNRNNIDENNDNRNSNSVGIGVAIGDIDDNIFTPNCEENVSRHPKEDQVDYDNNCTIGGDENNNTEASQTIIDSNVNKQNTNVVVDDDDNEDNNDQITRNNNKNQSNGDSNHNDNSTLRNDDISEHMESLTISSKQTVYPDYSSNTNGNNIENGEVEASSDYSSSSSSSYQVRYLLDYTLNRFTRWLRILGIDAALETDEQEVQRTKHGNVDLLFDRCRKERRTLITTSSKLQLRKNCPPGTYLVNMKSTTEQEQSLIHLLSIHGVTLQPSKFLTRCIVCNGNIVDVKDKDLKRQIFITNSAPDLSETDLNVYACDRCNQGYWWCDKPTSSATRVKAQATKLYVMCIRGGITVNEKPDHMFQFVNVAEEKRKKYSDDQRQKMIMIGEEGEDGRESTEKEKYEGDTCNQKDRYIDIIKWLNDEKLTNPFQKLRSSYASTACDTNVSSIVEKGRQLSNDDDDASMPIDGETLPFTNVTHGFVGTLDYVFFDTTNFKQTHQLYVPTSFKELNPSTYRNEEDDDNFYKNNYKGNLPLKNGHLLPSNIWPSDHLAVGSQLQIRLRDDAKELPTKTKQISNNGDSKPSTSSTGSVQVSSQNIIPSMPPMMEGGVPFCGFISDSQDNVTAPPPPPQPSLPPTVISKGVPSQQHSARCDCGCVPNVLSLFEMAELRKQARLKKEAEKTAENKS